MIFVFDRNFLLTTQTNYLKIMGGLCSTNKNVSNRKHLRQGDSTAAVLFQQIDQEGKGYISLKNLEKFMRDRTGENNTNITGSIGSTTAPIPINHGTDAKYIMNKYGTDNIMKFEQFQAWWSSTYTTYNDDTIAKFVQEADADMSTHLDLPMIPEDRAVTPKDEDVPTPCVAVSRS